MRSSFPAVLLLLSAATQAQVWLPLGSGCDDPVYSVEVYNGKLYAAGQFEEAGGDSCSHIARWDGSAWSVIPGFSAEVLSDGMAVVNGRLHVPAFPVVQAWNDTAWSIYPGTFGNQVFAITEYNGELHVGGVFHEIDGVITWRIARWTGSAWAPLSTGCNSQVNRMVEYNGDLIVCGNFTTAGGSPAMHVARWDGSTFHAMGSGTNGHVYATAVYNNELYIGGEFTMAGGDTADYLARWDGTDWQALPPGGPDTVSGAFGNRVFNLLEHDGLLYVGGRFQTPAHNVMRFDGSTWSGLGNGTGSQVVGMAIYHDSLHVSGHFTTAGGMPAQRVARWSIPPPPTAAATVAEDSLCAGTCTAYTDASLGATAWDWTFPGGLPATSNAQNPMVCYGTPGIYDAHLVAISAGGSSTTVLTDAVVVDVCTGIDEQGAAHAIILSPNPCTTAVLQVQSPNTLRRIELLDATGKVVADHNGMVSTIAAPQMSGTYLVRATHADGYRSVARFVKY